MEKYLQSTEEDEDSDNMENNLQSTEDVFNSDFERKEQPSRIMNKCPTNNIIGNLGERIITRRKEEPINY